MAIPARAATFDTSKMYYIDISHKDLSWYTNDQGVPRVYGFCNDVQATLLPGSTRVYAIKPTISDNSTSYIKRYANWTENGSTWWHDVGDNEVCVTLSSSSINCFTIAKDCKSATQSTISDTWEVMVAKKGSSTYTSYSVSGSTSLTSAEFTIENGDHFYLKHTIGSLATVKHYKHSDDMSLSTSSSSKYDYMLSSGSSDVSWTGKTSKIKLYFQYSGENPYNIYCSGSEVATAPDAPTFDWDKTKNQVSLSGEGTIYYSHSADVSASNGTKYTDAIQLKEGDDYTIYAVAVNSDGTSEVASLAVSYTADQVFYIQPNDYTSVKVWAWNGSTNVFKVTDNDFAYRPDILNNYNPSFNDGYKCDVVKGHIGSDVVYKLTVNGSVTGVKVDDGSNVKNKEIKNSDNETFNGKLFVCESNGITADNNAEGWAEGDPVSNGKVVSPVISIYENDPNRVKITTTSSDATIYYTTDGKTPTTASTKYTGSFYISEDCTVKALAVKKGYTNSDVTSRDLSANLVVYMIDDGNWGKVPYWAWTQDGETILNGSYDDSTTRDILNFKTTAKNGHTCIVTKGTADGKTVYKIELCTDVFGMKFGGEADITMNTSTGWSWNGKIYKTSEKGYNMYDFDASKWKPVTSETVKLDGYYLIGDLNKWLNDDGTYTVKDENNVEHEYSYGYDPTKNGLASDYKFSAVTNIDELPQPCKDLSTTDWYSVDITKLTNTDIKGALYGQFVIYTGEFLKKDWEKVVNNTVYTEPFYKVNWTNYTQYNWTKELQEAYCTDADGLSKGLYANQIMQLYSPSGDNRNVCLAHNYYTNARLYFNPVLSKIYLAVSNDGDSKDLYIYYARLDYNKSGYDFSSVTAPTVYLNGESTNSNNYYINMTGVNGCAMTPVTSDNVQKINDVEYHNYFKMKLNPGMECPAGQKMTGYLDASEYPKDHFSIEGRDVNLSDYIYIFYNTANMAVDVFDANGQYAGAKYVDDIESVECRVYGYSKDGSKIQVCGKDGTFYDAEPTDDQCWTLLNQGYFSTDPNFHSLTFDTWVDKTSDNADQCTVWSSYSNGSNSMKISAVNATKFIQFRVKYKLSSQYKSNAPKRVAATDADDYETLIMPDYFETSRPADGVTYKDSEYTWVLTGTSRMLNMSGIETGVEDLFEEEQADEVEGVEVETIYYNLQGQRIKNPDHGIYIRVRGNRADKVAL
jgi:hypothetical protein